MNLNEFLSKIPGKHRKTENGYLCHCPAHSDNESSLSISENNGKILIKCFAGCTCQAVLSAIGVKINEIFPDSSSSSSSSSSSMGLLEKLSEKKKIPIEFLKSIGIRENKFGNLIIPYYDNEMKEQRTRIRKDISASSSIWDKYKTKNLPIIPYGIWLMKNWKKDYVIFVEGESDAFTLWFFGYQAIGIPSNQMQKKLLPYLEQFQNKAIYVVMENDEGGKTFVSNMSQVFTDIKVINPIRKDISDLYLENPNNFVVSFDNCIRNAKIKDSNSNSNSNNSNNSTEFTCSDSGIFLGDELVCSQPVKILDKVCLVGDEESTYVTLGWGTNEVIVPMSYLQAKNADKLADRGIEIITSQQAKLMSQYFSKSLCMLETRRVYKDLGWHNGKFAISGMMPERNLMPDIRNEYLVNDGNIELGLQCIKNLLEVSEDCAFLPILITSLLAPAAEILNLQEYKFCLFLVGQTGNYKTTLAGYATSIYGIKTMRNFLRFGEGGTIQAIIKKFSVIRNLPILVDNYKPNIVSERELIYIINSIVEGKEKLRLDTSGKFRPSSLLEGWPILTGEALVETDTAALARCLVLEIRKTKNASLSLHRAKRLSENLPSLGKYWLSWLQSRSKVELEKYIDCWESIYSKWHEKALSLGVSNSERVAANFSMIKLAFNFICSCPIFSFLSDYVFVLDSLLDSCMAKMAVQTQEAREAKRFLDILSELIVSESVELATNENQNPSSLSNKQFIGWDIEEKGVIYILGEITLFEIKKKERLAITRNALYSQLKEIGAILLNSNGRNDFLVRLGNPRRVTRVIALDRKKLIMQDNDNELSQVTMTVQSKKY